MSELFEKRINELRKALTTPQEAALLTNEVNIGYFCGFFHSEGYLVVTQEKVCLLVDFRYIEAAQKKAQGCEVRLFHKLSEDLLAILTDQGIACRKPPKSARRSRSRKRRISGCSTMSRRA